MHAENKLQKGIFLSVSDVLHSFFFLNCPQTDTKEQQPRTFTKNIYHYYCYYYEVFSKVLMINI